MNALSMFSAGNPYLQYYLNLTGRTFTFLNTMGERSKNHFDHLRDGQPPVLVFPYKVILDGQSLDRPVNYSLAKIEDRRQRERRVGEYDSRVKPIERRQGYDKRKFIATSIEKKVFIVIDPRAGHGPGIAGSKNDSQIKLALEAGFEVYFFLFSSFPQPSQTIADVREAGIRFLKEVARLHPGVKLRIGGNCQAGWAAMLLAVGNHELIGEITLNGAPLSYLAGEKSQYMRDRGFLFGKWLLSLLLDLGNDLFDGAHLVTGFEDLNPANTYVKKKYKVFANPIGEGKRFCDFEKWWCGFYLLNKEEIRFIVDELFVGNKLERGELRMSGEIIDLKSLRDMVIKIFASWGDNITPPPQALGWLLRVYGTDAEIVARNLVIIYSLHPNVGHLGIFVGSKINNEYHREFIGGWEMFKTLPPGVYRMEISGEKNVPNGVYHESDPSKILYNMRIVKSSLDEIRDICGETDETPFKRAEQISDMMDICYRTFVRPWIKPFITESVAEVIRQMHPLRVEQHLFSIRNPFMWPINFLAPWWIENCPTVEEDNPLLLLERSMMDSMASFLDIYRQTRDDMTASIFESLFGGSKSRAKEPMVLEDYSKLAN